MTEKIFSCAYCAKTITSTTSPNQGGCTVKNSHWWVTIGEVGDRKLTCKHCNITVSVNSPTRERSCF